MLGFHVVSGQLKTGKGLVEIVMTVSLLLQTLLREMFLEMKYAIDRH